MKILRHPLSIFIAEHRNELKNYKLSLWENAKHSDGKGKYQEGFIEFIGILGERS
jgi:hypothetical protein